MILIYLVLLMIAPQLWVKPVIGLPVDYFLYPLWFVVISLQGKVGRFFEFKTPDFIFLAMICWIILTSTINSSNMMTGKIIIDYLKFFMIYRLTIISIDSFDKLKQIIYILLAISFVLVLESIQHKISIDGLGWAGQQLGWADNEIIKASGSGRTRWVNIFDGPGVFCVIFTNALPFCLLYFDKHFSAFKKIFSSILVFLICVAIYFTGSRGGFLASMVIFFIYIAIRSQISLRKIIFSSIIIAFFYIFSPAYLTSTSDSHKSAQNRVDMWEQGMEMTKYNPVFGIGKGNFKQYSGKLIAHNSAIEVMGETGLPGFFIWVSLIFVSLKGVVIFYKNSESPIEQSYAKAIGISIIGYLSSAMFVTLEYETFYFLLALAASILNCKNIPIDYNKRDIRWVCGGVIMWLCVLKTFLVIYFL